MMSSKQQYIDFFNAQRDAIEAKSTHALNALRQQAYDAFLSAEMPNKGDEDYEITDINALFTPDYGINVNRRDLQINPADSFHCDVPHMSTWLYFLFNDSFKSGNTSGTPLPDGVIVASLHEAAQSHQQLVEKYYAKIATLASNPQVALNTMLVQDGIFIYIPKGVKLSKPLQLVNILNSSTPFLANRRVLIVVEDNAQAKLLVCDHTQSKGVDYLNSQVVEIYLGENSTFDIYDLEESNTSTCRISSLYAQQKQGSNLLINGMTLINGITRNNYHVDIAGSNCETQLYGMAITNGSQHVDNYSRIAHNAPHSVSNELFKYVLDDNSKGAFTGKILVKEGAAKTEAYQSNKNICASPSAKMHSKPQLEIYTDDVKCSHGATIGQLDYNALFYMRTRGLSESDAKLLLMQAFMSDVISKVRIESLKDRLRHLVEKRFNGTLALCNECGISCHDNTKEDSI